MAGSPRVFRTLLLLFALPFLLFGCAPSDRLKIIMVGIDGAEWELIDPLIARGKLPNFKKLREQGKTGELITDYSNYSPSIWSSIVTGKLPKKHGITNFMLRAPRSYYEIPVTSLDRKAASLWNILSHENRKTATIAWWASWPAEEVKGCIVTQRFFLSSFGVGPIGGKHGIGVGDENPNYAKEDSLLAWPEDLSGRLRDSLAERVKDKAAKTEMGKTLRSLHDPNASPSLRHDLAVLENIFHTDLLVKDCAHFLERETGPFDLMSVYFEGIDVASHLFWKYLFPDPWQKDPVLSRELPPDFEKYAPVIPLYYEEMDGILGEFLAEAGPGRLVMVLSDHGFGTYFNPFDYNYPVNNLLERMGYLFRDKEGNIDYARTRCFGYSSNPWQSKRKIHFNLLERYPEGIVPPEQIPALETELINALSELRTRSGEKVVLSSQPFQGRDPSTGSLGVSVTLNPKLVRDDRILIQGKEVPVSEIFPPRTLSGNHRPQGILGFYGGGIKAGRLAPNSSLDIAPTVLALLGIPYAEDMDGKPCRPIVDELGGTVSSVSSYDYLLPTIRRGGGGNGAVNEAVKARLRALGYIQ